MITFKRIGPRDSVLAGSVLLQGTGDEAAAGCALVGAAEGGSHDDPIVDLRGPAVSGQQVKGVLTEPSLPQCEPPWVS